MAKKLPTRCLQLPRMKGCMFESQHSKHLSIWESFQMCGCQTVFSKWEPFLSDLACWPDFFFTVQLLSSHCRDPAVMIRKQIIGNMTDLLKAHFRTNSSVLTQWVLSVMPCLQDPESKAQELVQEVFFFFCNVINVSIFDFIFPL